jgi:predicted PurR-regulated permease PerM
MMQSLVNLLYGVAAGAGLWALGVPYALGVGHAIGAGAPILISLAAKIPPHR